MNSSLSNRNAKRRVAGVLAALVGLAVFAAGALPVQAARPVRVYDVTVKGPDSVALVQDAMRQALVRATGSRSAASDPALLTLIAEAPRYVRSRRPAGGGSTVISFDGAAVEREIIAAGRSVWRRDRPFTLVILNPPLTGAAADSARRNLEQVAETRGLPLSLVPMQVVDANGVELSPDTLLQLASQRFGGDAVLIGRSDGVPLQGQWQWTLQTNFGSESFTGPLDAGVHAAADALARVQDTSISLSEAEMFIEVEGIASLTDYAAVTRLLSELPGVGRANLEEANGGTATFRLMARGGGEVVERALDSSARFVRAGGSSSRLIYQYRP